AVANEGATIKMIGATFQKNPFTVLSLKDGADIAVGAAVANEGATIKMIGATFQKNPFTVLSLKDGADIA
ncbi:hypothetical protein BMR86_25920, partial [Stenotrophomonas sp. KAs 5-3]